MRLVDSHCHLDDRQFDADRDQVLARARAQGIERLVSIGSGDGPPDLEAGIRMAEQYQEVLATVGVHPHNAGNATPGCMLHLRRLLDHPKVVAVGEIGLDYHYDFSPRDVQRRVFIEQLEIATQAQKPVIIHTREAWEDTLSILRQHWCSRGGILHCFTGGVEQARQALELGFHLSFGGVTTFPRAENVRQAACVTPEDRLLVETDAPYLAPVPNRGKRNEPAFLIAVVHKLAELRATTPESIAQITTNNFERLCLR